MTVWGEAALSDSKFLDVSRYNASGQLVAFKRSACFLASVSDRPAIISLMSSLLESLFIRSCLQVVYLSDINLPNAP